MRWKVALACGGCLINWQASHAYDALQRVLAMEPAISATGAWDSRRFGITQAAWAAIRAAALTPSSVTLRLRPYSLNTEMLLSSVGMHQLTLMEPRHSAIHSERLITPAATIWCACDQWQGTSLCSS